MNSGCLSNGLGFTLRWVRAQRPLKAALSTLYPYPIDGSCFLFRLWVDYFPAGWFLLLHRKLKVTVQTVHSKPFITKRAAFVPVSPMSKPWLPLQPSPPEVLPDEKDPLPRSGPGSVLFWPTDLNLAMLTGEHYSWLAWPAVLAPPFMHLLAEHCSPLKCSIRTLNLSMRD